MPGVFVSYRRTDAESVAPLKTHLEMRFGDDAVFVDIDDIEPGDDWWETIVDAISGCEAFLAVVGPEWLSVAKDGVPRIEREDDVLRQEIEHALDQGHSVVIPVLVDGATMPAAEQLPEPIQGMAAHQAAVLAPDDWMAGVEKLLDVLSEKVASFRGTMSVGDAQGELYDLQQSYFEALNANDAAGALERAREASQLLDKVMPLYPQDPWLKTARGHVRKNEATALRRLERVEEADTALDKAASAFETMTREDPEHARAWAGLGRVVILQGGDREQALRHIDKALEKGYTAARRDREQVERQVDLGSFSGWWEQYIPGGMTVPPHPNDEDREEFDYAIEIAGPEGIALTSPVKVKYFEPGDTVLRIDRSTGDRFAGQAIHPVTGKWTGIMGTLGQTRDGRPHIHLDWAGGSESELVRPKRPGA